MKSINEISLNITEPEYRNLGGFSYSQLGKFLRAKDPKSLIDKSKQESDSLRFGSLVDCLLTEPKLLAERFYIVNFKTPPATIISILLYLFNLYGKTKSFKDITDKEKIDALNVFDYGTTWQASTRLKRLTEHEHYYNTLVKSNGKTVMSEEDLALAEKCVHILKTNPFTAKYMDAEDPFEDTIESFYQLKFTSTYQDHLIRCMFDKIIVNHKDKTIQPIDLKTTSKKEERFAESVLDWDYYIQATMYTQILLDNILKDEYYKDFKILPFKFIVISRFDLTPLIWTYPLEIVGNTVIEPQRMLLDKHGYPDWKQLVIEAAWHFQNNKFDYSYTSYMNNGEREIDFLHLLY